MLTEDESQLDDNLNDKFEDEYLLDDMILSKDQMDDLFLRTKRIKDKSEDENDSSCQ